MATLREFPITRELVEIAGTENDCDDLIKTINGNPIYTRNLELGEDWIVVLVLYDQRITINAMHRTEDKQTRNYRNLRDLLDGIEDEFGPEYLPTLPSHVLESRVNER